MDLLTIESSPKRFILEKTQGLDIVVAVSGESMIDTSRLYNGCQYDRIDNDVCVQYIPTPTYHPSRQQCAPTHLADHGHQSNLYHREQSGFPHPHEDV